MIEEVVLRALREAPASAGALIERLDLEVPSILVYGAVANLAAAGAIEEAGSGPGERIWGVPGGPEVKPKEPGLPASFSLSAEEIGTIDRQVGSITAGLPRYYFEELRRALILRADRKGRLRLDELGPPRLARRFLRRVQRGAPVRLRLRSPARWLVRLLFSLACLAALRLFVVGVYTVPPTSISMAPALIPAAEGGDALVLANLTARQPARGEVWIFRRQHQTFVKRVMGLPGERIEIKQGDLFINGRRLIKERDLLERVRVPLDGLRETDVGWVLEAQPGFLLPDGRRNPIEGDCRDVVCSARVHARGAMGSFMLSIEDGRGAPHTLLLARQGGAAVRGVEIATGPEFWIEAGRTIDVWVTNADGCFRVELDGHEVARAPIRVPGLSATVRVVAAGEVDVEGLEVSRDLIYQAVEKGSPWQVGPDQVFMLGDNSSNSYDSRLFAAVARDRLLGRVFAVVWPLGRLRWIR